MTLDPSLSLKARLGALADGLPPENVTVEALVTELGRDGTLLLAIFLCLPFLLPVQIPGISTVFGLLILLVGVGVVANRAVWLPARIKQREFASEKLRGMLASGAKWVDRMERMSRPRLSALTDGHLMQRINGIMIVLGAAMLMVPLAVIPFSNTLPALAIMFLSVGIVQRDGGCVLIGMGFNALTIVYFALIAALGATAVLQLFSRIPGLG
jgi:hypothetical protein